MRAPLITARTGVLTILIFTTIACLGMLIAQIVVFCSPTKDRSGVKEQFEELEFVVIHRPHLTYFVDLKYELCFATRKPDYQDLTEFACPEYLLTEAELHKKRQVEKRQKNKKVKKQPQQSQPQPRQETKGP